MYSKGGVRKAGPGEDQQEVINEAGKQEIALTLTNKYESLIIDDSADMKALFARYKLGCRLSSTFTTALVLGLTCTHAH